MTLKSVVCIAASTALFAALVARAAEPAKAAAEKEKAPAAVKPAQPGAQGQPGGAATKPASSGAIKPGAKAGTGVPLTDEEIAGLKTSWEKEGRQIKFSATFEPLLLSAKETKKGSKAEKLRYKITAKLFEYKQVGQRFTEVLVNESFNVYLLDPAGKVVKKETSIPITKLASESSKTTAQGGLTGDVDDVKGRYKVIIWTDSKKFGMLGCVLTTELPPANK